MSEQVLHPLVEGRSSSVTLTMQSESVERLQLALQWATSKLAANRRSGAVAVEHLRWLDWGRA